MNLAIPAALAWSALLLPVILFYILKVRLRRVPVSTTMFWRQIFEEKPPRSLWETLRHLLSLATQLALLLLLVIALCEPYFPWEILAARRIVLVVDNSASMSATDVFPSRFSEAVLRGLKVIDGLRFRDELAIVVAGTEPTVACGMTGHLRTLKSAMKAIERIDGPTHLKEAVKLGQRLIGDHAFGKVIVLSDGCCPEAIDFKGDANVDLQLVGGPAANVGITQFQVRRSLVDSLGYEILIEVLNASEDVVECRLELELNRLTVDVIPLTLQPGQTYRQTMEKTSLKGGRLEAILQLPDVFPGDNRASAILPTRDAQPVYLVTAGNLFLQKVLEANPLLVVKVVDSLPPMTLPGTLTVFHRQVPATLPAGPVMIIDPMNNCDLFDVGEELNAPLITQQATDSALMAHVRLDNVQMPTAQQLKFHTSSQTLAGALSNDPILVSVNRPNGKVLVLTANLDEGDLAFRTAFPILVSNAISWFNGNCGELREALPSGATTEIELPAVSTTATTSTVDYSLISPKGVKTPLPKGLDKITVGPLETCGIWQVAATASDPNREPVAPLLELACNLANATESRLKVAEELAVGSQQIKVTSSWFSRPIWFYLVALAWLLVIAEWFLYQRRYIS